MTGDESAISGSGNPPGQSSDDTEQCEVCGEERPSWGQMLDHLEQEHPELWESNIQEVFDPETGDRLWHYEWNGWLWCDKKNEPFDWQTGDVECPHCGDEIHVSGGDQR